MNIKGKKAILIQARTSSERFPKKMMQALGSVPLVEFVYKRCATSKLADIVAVITSLDKSDDELFGYCVSRGLRTYRGPLENVLRRYILAAEFYASSVICRVCGDSPFVDTELIDLLFDMLIKKKLDYAAPDRQTCAPGFYSETFTLEAIKKAMTMAKSPEDHEHVTKYILDNKDGFRAELIDAKLNPGFAKKVRFTIDYPEDIEVTRKIAAGLPDAYSFSSSDVLNIIEAIK